jgi:Transposase DDE domain.
MQGHHAAVRDRALDNVGGYFITRLPADRDPVIVRQLRRHRGRARKVKDMPLRQALAGLKRTVLDVECAFRCKVRRYRTRYGHHVTERFRVVAVHNAETGEWHVYVTNVPITVLTGELVARTYRLRWEVEQFFKLGKSGSGLHEMPSANEDVVRTLIYAALCRATVSMRGRRAVQAILGGGRTNHIHALSWHKVWLLHALAALRLLLPPPPRLALDQLRRLCAEPNPNRWCTLTSFAEAA